MASPYGSLFSNLGKFAPEIGASFDEERRKKLQDQEAIAKLALYAQQTKGAELQNREAEDALNRKATANEGYDKYLSDLSSSDQLRTMQTESPLDFSMLKTAPAGAMEQNIPENLAAMGKLGRLAKMDQNKIIDLPEYDLARGSGYDEGIKNAYDAATKASKDTRKDAFNRVGARKGFQTPENVAATKKFILDNKEVLGIDDAYAEELLRQVDTGYAYDVNEMTRKMLDKELAIAPKVKEAYQLIEPKAEGAAAEQGAKANAPRRLEKTELESLRTKRSIFDDITSAQAKFKPEYATPYFGKLVKISFLKQNVPGFSDFISDLERGVGKYRKDQFGASQTEGEANNLKDAINKDLDVDPEVFLSQMRNFVSSLERDYADEVDIYDSDKVKVPDVFRSIRTRKSVNPNREQEPKPEQTDTVPNAKKQAFITKAIAAGYSKEEATAEADKRYGK